MKKKQQLKKRKKVVYDLICCKEYQPMRAKDLAVLLQVPAGKRDELHKVLDQLLDEGKIRMDKRGKYEAVRGEKKQEKREKNEKQKGVYDTGKFLSHPRGFGFVTFSDEKEDLFIPEENVGGAFHGDTVQVVLKKQKKDGKRQEGVVVKVLERCMEEIVGTYEECAGFGFVIPDNQRFSRDIFIEKDNSMNARSQDKVLVKIKNYGGREKSPEGKIKEILGRMGEKGVDILCIAKGYDLPMEFPEKAQKQADAIKETLHEGDFYGRTDLRHIPMVTIDGADAKDLDDAVSLKKEGSLYQLGVHIADVSNYVQYRSALDKEALKRGTSVYLADRVIPMLPKKLSNGICSLNAGEDRLALSCLMEINEKGKIVSHQILESVIHVNERMTYTDVNQILKGEAPELEKRYQDLVPMLLQMGELSKLLRRRRKKRGAIDFDFPESKLRLDENGKVVEIYAQEANAATKLIEDFMLAANETVAEEYALAGLPFVYRTHEKPDMEKIEGVLALLHSAGAAGRKTQKEITPKELQRILKDLKGMDYEPFFSRLILRSMKQAKYTTDCIGHFGLAAPYYCHFTSPIRRYPDLQIHRIIKETIRRRMTETKIKHYGEILEEVARQSSAMERRAEEVERETVKLKKAEYMKQHVGEVFTGTISSVTEWGLYVELPNTVEGLIRVSTLLDDYYTFVPEQYLLQGEQTGKRYRMGQKVKIRVERADLETKSIDFALEGED